ncbi:hypothetical protein PIB30_044373 [Stylosanthes scabra]|uniref:Uncharacterized protein n=1 Tax=Stylosanthes scabra TaxID=79078 RepID=A0ABU6UFK4_9FABA|nr:hypothetical protein [Stylosanthes scabra]
MASGGRGRGEAVRDPDINRLDKSHHVAGALGFETPRKLTPRGVLPNLRLPECLVKYIHEAVLVARCR